MLKRVLAFSIIIMMFVSTLFTVVRVTAEAEWILIPPSCSKEYDDDGELALSTESAACESVEAHSILLSAVEEEPSKVLVYHTTSLLSDYPHDPRGEITDVGIVWPTCYQGEDQEIYVEFQNPTSTTYHYLVAINVIDPSGNTVYDSHTVGEDKDIYVNGGQTVFLGTWYYTLPHTAPVGTYHVLAGLKLYPWTELDYRGESWCEPEETFTVKPSYETIVGVSGDPYDDDSDGYFDSMRVQVLAHTNALEELDVEVYGDLKDPDGNIVETDGSGMWTVPAGAQSWSYAFYLFVPSGSPVGKYSCDLYLYDATHRNNNPGSDPEDTSLNAISLDPLYPPGYGNLRSDLIISDITWTPASPRSGDAMTFTVYIRNQGPVDADPWAPFTVRYGVDDWQGEWTITSLGAGETISRQFTWSASPGDHIAKAYADYGSSVPETDEGNNERQETFSVTPRTVTVSGYLYYVDDDGYERPVRFALVELYDQDWEFDDGPWSAYTGSDGFFTIGPVDNIDNELGESGTRDLYIKVFTKNYAVDVKSPALGGNTYEFVSDTQWDVSDGEITWTTPSFTGDLAGACNIVGAITYGSKYVDIFDATPSLVTIRWSPTYDPTDHTSYYDLAGTIHLRGASSDSDQWDECVIIHEYGHFIMDKFFHSCFNGEKKVWEGWPQFFQSPVRRYWDFATKFSDYSAEEYDDPGISYHNLETWTLGDDYREFSSILWDIYDEPSDDQDMDGIGDTLFYGYDLGFEKIWNVFDDYEPETIDEFWSSWFSAGYDNGKEMACIFYEHGIQNKAPFVMDLGDDNDVLDSDFTDYRLWVEAGHLNGWRLNVAYGWGPSFEPPSSPFTTILDADSTSSSSFTTLEYYIPRSEMIAHISPSGITLWWKYEAVDLAWGASLGWSDWVNGGRCIDDDSFGPLYSNPTTVPSGIVYDSHSGHIRLQVDWTDISDIYEVRFRYKYGSGSWTVWLTPSDHMGSTYWYDMPRSEWITQVGNTIYWESYASDNDIDRDGDRLTTYLPTETGPTLTDDDTSGPSWSSPSTNPSGTVYDTYAGAVRLQVDWSDSHSIYEAKFRYKYGSGSWTSWLPPSGSTGNTYWYDIPRNEWVIHVGQTIYWESYATDNDDDGWSGDKSTINMPTQTGPSIIAGTLERYLVVRGLDNRIYYRVYSSSSEEWGSWASLPGATCDSPAAAVCGGKLHIVVRGLDGNSLWHGILTDPSDPISFVTWNLLGGSTPSAPTLTSNGTALCLVVRGLDDRIYYRCYSCSGGSWDSWHVVPTGATCDSPAAALLGNDLHIVVRGMDGDSLWHTTVSCDGTGSPIWTQISGATHSRPVLVQSSGKLYLSVRGLDNRIYYREYAGSWNAWNVLPTGATIDAPDITVVNGRLHFVVRGTDGNTLWVGYVDLGTSSFSGWTLLDGATPSAPTLTS